MQSGEADEFEVEGAPARAATSPWPKQPAGLVLAKQADAPPVDATGVDDE
jgi:hypothetical protein